MPLQERDITAEVKQIAEKVVQKPISDLKMNLFDAGFMDSLSAVNLLVAIEEQMGISLDLLEFARREQFTIDNIASMVSAAQIKS